MKQVLIYFNAFFLGLGSEAAGGFLRFGFSPAGIAFAFRAAGLDTAIRLEAQLNR